MRIFDTHELRLMLRALGKILVHLLGCLFMQSDNLLVRIPRVLHASVCDSGINFRIKRLLEPLLILSLPIIVT